MLTIEFLWWWVGLVVGFAHFHVQPNYSVEVELCCVVVGVVTTKAGTVLPGTLYNS